MAQESFPPERPFGPGEDEHDEVRGHGLQHADEGDASVAPIDEPPGPQAPADPPGGTDAAA